MRRRRNTLEGIGLLLIAVMTAAMVTDMVALEPQRNTRVATIGTLAGVFTILSVWQAMLCHKLRHTDPPSLRSFRWSATTFFWSLTLIFWWVLLRWFLRIADFTLLGTLIWWWLGVTGVWFFIQWLAKEREELDRREGRP